MSKGVVLFLKYAISPNQLALCGPGEKDDLLAAVLDKKNNFWLSYLIKQFEGAYPYLKLIAAQNHIADPLDKRVVEAYWIGNGLLDGVRLAAFWQHITERFKRRMGLRDWLILKKKMALSPKPHHSFHVFNVWLPAQKRNTNFLEILDNCKISWGQVLGVADDRIEAGTESLSFKGNDLVLIQKKKKIFWRVLGKELIGKPRLGDWVSFHWDWAAEKLSQEKQGNLKKYTQEQIGVFNLKKAE